MKKILKSLFIVSATLVILVTATQAVWTAETKVYNDNSFKTGNADLQVWDKNYSGEGWQDSINAPTFDDIYPNWEQDYSLKVKNNGTVNLAVTLNQEWKGGWANWKDPNGLRHHIWLEVWKFNDDNNNNKLWDSGEDVGGRLGKRKLSLLDDSPINLGEIDEGGYQWYLFRFTADGLDGLENSTLQKYTFVFDGTTAGVTQTPAAPKP